MRPWLRLLERIHDLPIEQLDQHMARTLADELGVPYQPVRSPIPALFWVPCLLPTTQVVHWTQKRLLSMVQLTAEAHECFQLPLEEEVLVMYRHVLLSHWVDWL
jgi:hypothetical protein